MAGVLLPKQAFIRKTNRKEWRADGRPDISVALGAYSSGWNRMSIEKCNILNDLLTERRRVSADPTNGQVSGGMRCELKKLIVPIN